MIGGGTNEARTLTLGHIWCVYNLDDVEREQGKAGFSLATRENLLKESLTLTGYIL